MSSVIFIIFTLLYLLCVKVIGLTATIGVGNANNDKQAVDHMLKICANLDVETIATVEDENNIADMRKFTSRPKEGMCSILSILLLAF